MFGVLILADFSARLIISRQPLRDLARLSTWSDIVAIISFLAPLAGEAGGFQRAFRTLRLLRDYQMVSRLRVDSSFFRQNEEIISAVANLAMFIFVMTGIVYETILSISHDIIVKQDGGSIEVDTKPGEFAEIRLTLARTGALLPERQ